MANIRSLVEIRNVDVSDDVSLPRKLNSNFAVLKNAIEQQVNSIVISDDSTTKTIVEQAVGELGLQLSESLAAQVNAEATARTEADDLLSQDIDDVKDKLNDLVDFCDLCKTVIDNLAEFVDAQVDWESGEVSSASTVSGA